LSQATGGTTVPKALVTGANGFIGSHLVRELLHRGYEVNCLVRSTSDIRSLQGLPISLFVGDIRDPGTLVAPLRGVDYVFHLAAALMVTSQEEFDETNAGGTLNVLKATGQEVGGRLKRFLYVSSEAAVGPGPDPTPLDETAELRPISWYGQSKVAAERHVRSFAGQLPATIVRLSSVYGEREQDISQAFPVIEKGLQPKIGLEEKATVLVYVADVVRGMVDAVESPNAVDQVYFLAHPRIWTAEGVTRTIAAAMGRPNGIMFPVPLTLIKLGAPLAEFVHEFTRQRPSMTRDKAREVSQRYWVIDPSKAKRDFGWEAAYDLPEGMRRATAYFLDQERASREMAREKQPMLWLKFLACAMALGSLIEVTSALGKFYAFRPRWGAIAVVVGGFGLSLGTVSMKVRQQDDVVQFGVGTLLATTAELSNELGLSPGISWRFAPGWPLGIQNGILRALVLGTAGGGFVLVVNAMMRAVYERRLRFG
jgi:nucleoside-diphosphate-sugar epimerase